jgi:thiamine biosynthesis lipoprotein
VDPTVGSVTLTASSTRIHRQATYRDVAIADGSFGAVVSMPPGIRLDLGATTKAWTADQAAHIAAAACGSGALVNLLGDVATAGEAPENGWAILVTDDHREGTASENAIAQIVSITQGGLATSGTTVRHCHLDDGSIAPHIIDPRTMEPVFPLWRTVSVFAGDCLTANSASTAAIILGENAVHWLEETGLPARLVDGNGAIAYVAGWPEATAA